MLHIDVNPILQLNHPLYSHNGLINLEINELAISYFTPSYIIYESHVLLDTLRLTWQDVHVAVLGYIAGLFGFLHRVPRENSWDALKADEYHVI